MTNAAQAIAHGEAIMDKRTYRHQINGGVEFHHVHKVKVLGSALNSEYTDEFCRT